MVMAGGTSGFTKYRYDRFREIRSLRGCGSRGDETDDKEPCGHASTPGNRPVLSAKRSTGVPNASSIDM